MPGDMATVAADGTIRLLGRGSMCINTGGEKVPDQRFGQRVAVVVALRDGDDITFDALQDACRPHLAGYKVPRDLIIVDEVRRSPSGKPDYPWAMQEAVSRL
jgi:acyl-CoA synthetase (AMP-forming)/AMP-acid ligase II